MLASPRLVTPDPTRFTTARHGRSVISLIDGTPAGTVPDSPISVDRVTTHPGRSEPYRDVDSWVHVLLWSAGPLGAMTAYGPTLSHQIPQAVGQVLVIPPGLPYVTINPHGADDVVTYEFRAKGTVHHELASPFLVTPDPTQLTLSRQGQPMISLIDGTPAGNVPGSPISAGRVSMRPGHLAEPHYHIDSWVYVLLWSAGPLGAITLSGQTLDGRTHQTVGQLLVIPPGVPHAAVNPNVDADVIAYEFRADPSIHNDNVVLEHLRPHLSRQQPVLFDLPQAAPKR